MLQCEVKYLALNRRSLKGASFEIRTLKGTDNQPVNALLKTTEFPPIKIKRQTRQVGEFWLIAFFGQCVNLFTVTTFYNNCKFLPQLKQLGR